MRTAFAGSCDGRSHLSSSHATCALIPSAAEPSLRDTTPRKPSAHFLHPESPFSSEYKAGPLHGRHESTDTDDSDSEPLKKPTAQGEHVGCAACVPEISVNLPTPHFVCRIQPLPSPFSSLKPTSQLSHILAPWLTHFAPVNAVPSRHVHSLATHLALLPLTLQPALQSASWHPTKYFAAFSTLHGTQTLPSSQAVTTMRQHTHCQVMVLENGKNNCLLCAHE